MKRKLAMILMFFLIFTIACNKVSYDKEINYKDEMKKFVSEISMEAKKSEGDFYIITQNAEDIIYGKNEEIDYDFLNCIDGIGKESLYYGYDKDDKKTNEEEVKYIEDALDVYLKNNKVVLVTNYCSSKDKMQDGYNKSYEKGYVSFSADKRMLDDIPDYPEKVFMENSNDVTSLNGVKNFLYLINPSNYETKEEFIEDVSNTNYDLIIMDLFLYDDIYFTAEEIEKLKTKDNGGKRIVIAYMSIGEAESYRYYWDDLATEEKKKLINDENKNWEENYNVAYWDDQWKEIIIRREDSYLKRIINSNFDGVYLDIVDAYEFYE